MKPATSYVTTVAALAIAAGAMFTITAHAESLLKPKALADGKWQPLQYLARRFFEPVHVTLSPDGMVKVVNDTNKSLDGDVLVLVVSYPFDGSSPGGDVRDPIGGGSPRVRPHWWSKSGGVTEYLVNCSPCDAQGTFKRTDATT